MIPCNELIRAYNLYPEEYDAAALRVLKSGWYILGKEVETFEKEFAESLGGECYFAGTDNGLNAIRMGLHAYGIGTGDEVIMQSNGYIATTLGITQNGATPVFVEPDKYHNIDADKIEAAITDRTKAVLVTHLYGMCTNQMEKIQKICMNHGLKLFEDCCESHYATWNGIQTGLFGDAGFFSFYPTKNLGGYGDGGGVVSKNKEYIDKIKMLRNYGSDYQYHNIMLGFNSRLDELQAALLRVKLTHMEEYMANRRHVAERYLAEINNEYVRLPEIIPGGKHVWYLFVVNVDDQTGFREYLKENGVGTAIHFPVPPHLEPCMSYLNLPEGSFPIAEKDCKTVVSLPMMDVMSEEEIDKVVNVVNSYKK